MTDRGPEHIEPRPLAGYVMRDYEHTIATLRDARESRGHIPAEIAARIGASSPQVWRWETGRNAPHAPALFALAHALGYDLALIPREDA